jgi:hypothetical protein
MVMSQRVGQMSRHGIVGPEKGKEVKSGDGETPSRGVIMGLDSCMPALYKHGKPGTVFNVLGRV